MMVHKGVLEIKALKSNGYRVIYNNKVLAASKKWHTYLRLWRQVNNVKKFKTPLKWHTIILWPWLKITQILNNVKKFKNPLKWHTIILWPWLKITQILQIFKDSRQLCLNDIAHQSHMSAAADSQLWIAPTSFRGTYFI